MKSRCKFNWQYSNDMTRRLAGMAQVKWILYHENRYHSAVPTREDLDRAKHHLLNTFDAVCFLEYLPLCMDRIRRVFHVDEKSISQNATEGMKTNKENKFRTKTRPGELDDITTERFRLLNELDLELYHWALSQFLH